MTHHESIDTGEGDMMPLAELYGYYLCDELEPEQITPELEAALGRWETKMQAHIDDYVAQRLRDEH